MHDVQQATALNPISFTGLADAGPHDGAQVLMAARRVAGALRGGSPQTEVARRAESPLAYGIGLMIYKLVEKRLLDDEEIAFRSLTAQIGRAWLKTGQEEPVNRRTVISNLRKMSLIDPTLSVRTIKPSGSTPSVSQIIRVTEEATRITAEEILSKNRSRPIVNARFCAMWALRTVSGTSFSVIGEHFGGKDHTTVINAVNQVEVKRSSDNALRQSTDQIVDAADMMGIRSNMDLLTRTAALRSV